MRERLHFEVESADPSPRPLLQRRSDEARGRLLALLGEGVRRKRRQAKAWTPNKAQAQTRGQARTRSDWGCRSLSARETRGWDHDAEIGPLRSRLDPSEYLGMTLLVRSEMKINPRVSFRWTRERLRLAFVRWQRWEGVWRRGSLGLVRSGGRGVFRVGLEFRFLQPSRPCRDFGRGR